MLVLFVDLVSLCFLDARNKNNLMKNHQVVYESGPDWVRVRDAQLPGHSVNWILFC